MRTLLFAASSLALTAGMAQAANLIIQQPVVDEVLYAAELPTEFYYSVEALAMWRSSTDPVLWRHEVTLDLNSSRDIAGLGGGLGARFAVGGPIADEWGWQISGFWAGSFLSSGTSITPGEDLDAVYDDDVTVGNLHFENSDTAYALTMNESSSVASFEANGTFGDEELRFFFGPRWVRYQSSLGTVVFDDAADFNGTDDDIDRVNIDSLNTLFGLNFGIEGMVPLSDSVSIGGRAAIGLYANHARLDRRFSTDDAAASGTPFTTTSVSDSSSTTGFAQSLELSPKVAVAVTENLDVSLGALLLFLNGVDEPGSHYAGIGGNTGGGGKQAGLAPDTPSLTNGVHFTGLTLGVQGRF